MICQVSDGRRGGLRKGVAARCRASGREVFAGESEAPERPIDGRHERVRKRQVFLATFCDFFGFFGRQHGRALPAASAAALCAGCRAPRYGLRRAARRRRRGEASNEGVIVADSERIAPRPAAVFNGARRWR